MSKKRTSLLSLAGELRNEIYAAYSTFTPETSGPLASYAVIDFALLQTSQQLDTEARPFVVSGPSAALLHPRVCLRLRSNDTEGCVIWVGWGRQPDGRIDIWVRTGTSPGEEDEMGWWVFAQNLWYNNHIERRAIGEHGDEVLRLAQQLEELSSILSGEHGGGPKALWEDHLENGRSRVDAVVEAWEDVGGMSG